jgi:hypothetical protein
VKTKHILATLAIVWLTLFALPAAAVEVTPRITDREIIEALTELKVGQKSLAGKMDQRFESMERRFDFFQNLLMVLIAGVFGLIGFVV